MSTSSKNQLSCINDDERSGDFEVKEMNKDTSEDNWCKTIKRKFMA